MSKERLVAFSDAVLAIVITILVLELKLPEEATITSFVANLNQFIAYASSFFWLSIMWVNLHNEWKNIKSVSLEMIWWTIFLLFLSSLLPYATSFASNFFNEYFAQLFYGLVVLFITAVFYILGRAAEKENPEATIRTSLRFKRIECLDYCIKVISFILGLFYPPLITFAIIITAVVVAFSISIYTFYK